MADITSRVRFIGDASQLLATYRAVGAQAAALQQQINRATTGQLARRGLVGENALGGLDQIGPVVRKVNTELDSFNNTFKRTVSTLVKGADGVEILTGSFDEYFGNAHKAIEATNLLDRAVATHGANVRQARNRLDNLTTGIRTNSRAVFDNIRAAEQAGITWNNAARRYQDAQGKFVRAPAGIGGVGDFNTLRQQESQRLQQALTSPQVIAARTAAIQAEGNATVALANANRQLAGALNSLPPVPADIQRLQQYPALLSQLRKGGLSTDPARLYAQQPRIDFTKDLVTGVTKVRGQFLELNKHTGEATGFVNRFSAELDKNGQVITRFGRNMSGLQNFLRQTVANFQKVIQWTVATTAVFGTFALAAKELSTLVDIDKTLKQLGVTAQLSASETRGLFTDIADVAYRTATPLSEMLKSADDIALAMRKSGQSAESYRQDIINLTEAVGIYTNLTGQDTVKATDTLVASMKQLDLESGQLLGLMSKITAVSGGQSNAIADVSVGLGVMAEAARQAGLSIDQTVAAVQVLSQVTSKSPDEVATAFKNLVGALDSRAGAKALKEFNIALRTPTGELRNILDIYGEIAEKIRQGVIPEADVKGLVKAIAGGPRRAPDAAALLSAIGDIEQVTRRSEAASNEAIIANAKILDTVQARMTRIKVLFDTFAFEKFGKGLSVAAEGILDALGAILKILNQLDSGLIATAIQVGVFFLAIRTGIAIARTIGGVFSSMIFGLRGLSAAYREAAVGASGLAAANGQLSLGLGGATGKLGIVSRLLGGKTTAGYGAIGAGIGAATSFASGGDLKDILSGGLSGLGFGLLVAPDPTGWTKLAGAIALGASTLLTFVGNNEEAGDSAEETAEKAEKMVNAFSKFEEAMRTIQDRTEDQKKLEESITNINSLQEKSAADLAALADYQKQYVTNTLEMADANRILEQSIEEIQTLNPKLASRINAARRGQLSEQELKRLREEIQLDFLRQTDAGANIGDVKPVAVETTLIKPYVDYESWGLPKAPIISYLEEPENRGYLNIDIPPIPVSFDLREDLTRDQIKKIFDTEELFAQIDTGEEIDLLRGQLDALAATGDQWALDTKRWFDEWVLGQDAIRGAEVALRSFENLIGAQKLLDPEFGGELEKSLAILKEIVLLAGQQGRGDIIKTQTERYTDVATGQSPLDSTFLTSQIDQLITLKGLNTDITTIEAERQAVADYYGITLDEINAKKLQGKEISEAELENLQRIQESYDEYNSSIQQSVALKSAQLKADFQAGEFEGNEEVYNRQIAQLNAIATGVQQVTAAYSEAEQTIPGFQDALSGVAVGLENITGLQDASSLSALDLIKRMYDLANTYGISGAKTEELTGRLMNMLNTIKLINGIKAAFYIKGDMDISAVIIKLRAMAQAIRAIMPFGLGNIAALPFELAATVLQLANNQSTIDSNAFGSIYGSGSGGGFYTGGSGSGSKKGSTGGKSGSGSGAKSFNERYDTSVIDVPDAIAQAYNRDALIQEAIRRARALQSKLPGAAAEAKNDIVSVLQGTQKLIEVRGVKDDLLRRALEELAEIEKKRLEFETKADTIRRIRVGAGDFTALANVPLNTRTGVSVGSPNGPITVNLNINGQILTPAQFAALADQIAAAIKRQIGA